MITISASEPSGLLVKPDVAAKQQEAPTAIMIAPASVERGSWCYRFSTRLISSGEIVGNPSFKSDRDRRRRFTALQGEVAIAD